MLVPYPHCPWCSPVCEIVFFFFLKQPLQALVLLCFCIRIQATFKNISPRVQIKSLIIFDQCLSSSALGWYLASPQAAMSQRAFLVCGVARGNRAGDVTANRRNVLKKVDQNVCSTHPNNSLRINYSQKWPHRAPWAHSESAICASWCLPGQPLNIHG